MVKDISPGESSGKPASMTPLGDFLYFQVRNILRGKITCGATSDKNGAMTPTTKFMLPLVARFNAYIQSTEGVLIWAGITVFPAANIARRHLTATRPPTIFDTLCVHTLLAQQASGVDTGWMLPPQHQDLCGGFRESSFDSSVFFAVSEVRRN